MSTKNKIINHKNLLLFIMIIETTTIVKTAFTEIIRCAVGDFSKGGWEYMYPGNIYQAVCQFPTIVESYSAPIIEGGGYRGYLILHVVQPCDANQICPNNNFIFEPPGQVSPYSSAERYCVDAYSNQGHYFKDGYCFQPTGRPAPDNYACFFGGGQLVMFLQKWVCRPESIPSEPQLTHNQGPPSCSL